jgi:spermidine synthase
LFFISGAAGLGQQVVWSKMFAATLGHEFPAVIAVVSAFMAGMALGAMLFRKLRGNRNWYARFEFVIGVWAGLSIWLIAAGREIETRLVNPDATTAMHWAIAFGIVFVLLLPATIALGASFPAMTRLVNARRSGKVPLLYGVNTAGAVFGTLSASYLLMPRLGLRNSVLVYAGMSCVCGVLALRFSPQASETDTEKVNLPGRFWAMVFVTGLLGLGYEMAGIRILSHVLENTVFTFACALAIYLLGTALGAFFAQRKGFANSDEIVNRLLLALAGSVVLCGFLGRSTEKIYDGLRLGLGSSTMEVMFSELAVAGVIFLLPTLLMGAIFGLLAQKAEGARAGVSAVVALNSAGAALGPIIFGAVLYPGLGSKWTICLIALGYALVAGKGRVNFAAAAAIVIIGFVTSARITPIDLRPGEKIAAYREGVMGSVAVLQDTNGQRVLKVNNRFQMGGTAARIAEQRHADIPLLLQGKPKRALFIGLGTGITFSASKYYPGLVADGVELLPEVIEVMPMFAEEKSETARTHAADARRFVQSTTNRYDVIIADLFHPAQDGAGLLYTEEHFRAIQRCLEPSGLFCQWLPLYQLDEKVLKIITRTFLEVFPGGEAWLLRFNVDTPVLGLISRSSANSGALIEASDPSLEGHLRRVALNDPVRLWGCFLAGPGELRDFVRGIELNTDDRPRVIFDAPKYTYSPRPAYEILVRLLDIFHSDLNGIVPRGEFQSRVERYIRARNIYLRGLALEEQRKVMEAINAYIESAKISADFTTGYAQCLTIASALHQTNPEAAKALLKRLEEAQPGRGAAKELLERLDQQK